MPYLLSWLTWLASSLWNRTRIGTVRPKPIKYKRFSSNWNTCSINLFQRNMATQLNKRWTLKNETWEAYLLRRCKHWNKRCRWQSLYLRQLYCRQSRRARYTSKQSCRWQPSLWTWRSPSHGMFICHLNVYVKRLTCLTNANLFLFISPTMEFTHLHRIKSVVNHKYNNITSL